MTMYNLNKHDPLKFIFYLKKAAQKMAHPVPVYMEVTPPWDAVQCAAHILNLERKISTRRTALEVSGHGPGAKIG